MPVFPPPGGGNGPLEDIPPNYVYADPDGDDAATGVINAPFQTIYKALTALESAGGGTLQIAPGTNVGGPVVGQGIWIRSDGLSVPGFVSDFPLRITGAGPDSNYVFKRGSTAKFVGGTTDVEKPALWIVGNCTQMPKLLDNFGPTTAAGAVYCPLRMGWDYSRNSDGTVRRCTVTNANRAGGSTVLTVTLPAGYTVLQGKRIGTAVTLTVQLPAGIIFSPWYVGGIVRVVTSDTDFPSVDATVTGMSDSFPVAAGSIVTLQYTQAGSSVGSFQNVTGGTVTGHGCQAGDRLYLKSTSAEFFTVAYNVTAATVTTVTISDIYGYGTRSASTGDVANIGTMAKEERGRFSSASVYMQSVMVDQIHGLSTDLPYGPSLDSGSWSPVGLRMQGCYFDGYSWDPAQVAHADLDRAAAVLANAGRGTSGNTMYFYDCFSANGGIRGYYNNGNENYCTGKTWLLDTGGQAYPAFEAVSGNRFTRLDLDDMSVADANVAPVVLPPGQFDPLKVKLGFRFTNVQDEPIYGMECASPSVVWQNGLATTPWKTNRLGWWAGGLAGRHVGGQRAFGTVSPRAPNLFPKAADWTAAVALPAGVTLGTATGPDGTPGSAIKVTNASGNAALVFVGLQPFTGAGWVTGDYVAITSWVSVPSLTTNFLAILNSDDSVLYQLPAGTVDSFGLDPPFGQPGWQLMTFGVTITVSGTAKYSIGLNVPVGDTYLWSPTLLRLPAAIGDADFYEYAGTQRPQPFYLQPGSAGTVEGQKLIGHAGFGTNSANAKTVGVGSGQLTLTGSGTVYLPMYDLDGTTIIGWVAQLQATVNP